MKDKHKHSGSAYMLVILVFIFVSLFSALMLSNLNQAIFQNNAYGLQMQCYYLNNQAAKATVAALLADDNDLLNKIAISGGVQTTTMIHTDADGNPVGSSSIKLTRENHTYYNENKEWIVATIVTTIIDPRTSRQGKEFDYKGTAMILADQPLIQLFNVNPEDF